MQARPESSTRVPAQRIAADGSRHIDWRAVAALAAPLVLNTSIQAVLGLTDTWFIGRLSVDATAAISAVYWLVMLAMFLLSGATMAVQTLAAQAWGSGRYRRASQSMWMGLWGALGTLPLFILVILQGSGLLGPFGLPPHIEALAIDYWNPRMLGGPLAVALWGLTAYFNGIGHTRLPLMITLVVAFANVFLNEWFIFGLDLGIAGAAWATTAAQALGVVVALILVFRVDRARLRPTLTWRPSGRLIWRQFRLGVPMAGTAASDLLAVSLFQLMQVRIGAVDGAATQIVMVATSLSYMPGIGLALAGTTLVGQAIGAGDRDWAARLGSGMIRLVSLWMGGLGLLLALCGPWLTPLFVNASDPNATAVISLSLTLLWIAAIYQFADGLNFGSSFCLRGAGDVNVPAVVVFGLGATVFVPLSYLLTFAPGQGWFGGPGVGLGAIGGWSALAIYAVIVGVCLWLRWRSGSWRSIRLA
ncbi:MAG: MATE family efflux transporter [Steroidobacteraceae bacterium]